MLPPCGRQSFIRPLQDSLCSNVNPTAGGHLAVHDETEALELVELLPGGPVADQVGVGDEHAGRPLVSPENTDGFSRLNEQGLVVFEGLERTDDGVVSFPASRRTARSAVDNQFLGALGDSFVQVVHEHPHGRFLLPAFAGDGSAARRADGLIGPCHRSRRFRGGRFGLRHRVSPSAEF